MSQEIDHTLDKCSIEDYDELKNLLDDLKVNSQSIYKHGQRADSIVVSLMHHTSERKGNSVVLPVNGVISEAVRLTSNILAAQEPAQPVTLIEQLDDETGEVTLVPEEIRRVMISLLENAVDAVAKRAASENGSYEPTVTVASARNNGFVEIRVADNGFRYPR